MPALQHGRKTLHPDTTVFPPYSCPSHDPSPPSNVSISPVTSITLPAYRRLISTLLPIRYPDKFYKESIADQSTSSSVALCAVYHDDPRPQNGKRKRDALDSDGGKEPNVVAGIQARLEPLPPPPPPSSFPPTSSLSAATPEEEPAARHPEYQLYIQTLATLAPHRRLSVATHLLRTLVLTALRAHPDKSITSVYAHVWEANEDALAWYLNRGFSVEGRVVEGYYRRLRPAGARVLRKAIGLHEYLDARNIQPPGPSSISGDKNPSHEDDLAAQKAPSPASLDDPPEK
ncbi:MAG: hypothetical protein Q9163_001075 [Psora crenata]